MNPIFAPEEIAHLHQSGCFPDPNLTKQVSEFLVRARDTISTPDSWIKRDIRNKDGNAWCAEGALNKANWAMYTDIGSEAVTFWQNAKILIDALARIYANKRGLTTKGLAREFVQATDKDIPLSGIIQFNDHRDVTHQDIMFLFNSTISMLTHKERGDHGAKSRRESGDI